MQGSEECKHEQRARSQARSGTYWRAASGVDGMRSVSHSACDLLPFASDLPGNSAICRTRFFTRIATLVFGNWSLNDLELKVKIFASKDEIQIMLPKLSGEAESRPSPIQVDNKLQAQRPPQVRQRYISADWSQFEICVERETGVLLHEILKGITVQMIPVSRISRPIGV